MSDHEKIAEIKKLIDDQEFRHIKFNESEIYDAVKRESLEDILLFIHDLFNIIFDIMEVIDSE